MARLSPRRRHGRALNGALHDGREWEGSVEAFFGRGSA